MKRRHFITILCCNLLLTLTVLFFSPLEVVAINAGEFFFPLTNVWLFQLLVSVAGALLLTLFMLLFPARAGLTAAAVALGIGIAAYVQILFLNGLVPSLTGSAIKISSSDRIWNLVIWLAIILLVALSVFLFSRKARKTTELAMRAVAAALVIMQLTGVSLSSATKTTLLFLLWIQPTVPGPGRC